jgi:hypothetical protein
MFGDKWKIVRWALTVAWVLTGGWLSHATVDQVVDQWMIPPTPPEVTYDLIVKNASDDSGKRASFRILLFSDEFRWRLNSADAVEHTKSDQPMFSPEMKKVLNTAKEVICIGASSEEIPSGVPFGQGRAQEERRAARRAEQIAMWVRQSLSTPVPVRKLNVGHHAPTKGAKASGDTSDQRRVVIILVLDQDEGTNIDQSLRWAMASERGSAPVFESLLTSYSLSSGNKFTWVP